MHINDLDRLASALADSERLAPDIAAELAGAIRDALAGRQTLDAALGLRGGPGERTAATKLMLAKRDTLLRDAADRHLPGLPAAAQAAELATRWARYEATAWPRERAASECPRRHAGTVYASLWAAMKAGARPISAERIRRILAANSSYS